MTMSGQPERPEEVSEDQELDNTPDTDVGDENIASEAESTEDGKDALAEANERADENWDKFLRAAAELENVRKRAARDVEKAHKFALERFSADLLEVRDSLEMALSAGDAADAASLREGNETTLKLLSSIMQRFGVEELDPVGEPFDPERHEAMTMQPSPDVEPGSVITVFQKGYALNGRLLRPARVVVAKEAEGGS